MKIPIAIRSILSDQKSSSVRLLDRLTVAFENELMNTDHDHESFIALVRIVRERMKSYSVITHFCDELILEHEISPRTTLAAYLELIRQYKENRK